MGKTYGDSRLESKASRPPRREGVKSLGIDDAMYIFIESDENEDFLRFLP